MGFLYSVQSLLKNRHITISGRKGWVIEVIWANYLLGLKVISIHGTGRLAFGDGAEPHVLIDWVVGASSHRESPLHYPREYSEIDVEVRLHD